MRHPFKCIHNEEGSVIVLSVMVLVVLTIVGFSANRNSTTESQIVRNNSTYQKNFYVAESGAIEGAQRVSNENDTWTLRRQRREWLNRVEDVDLTNTANWDSDTTSANQNAIVSNMVGGNRLEVSVVDLGVAPGSSMDMFGTQLHEFATFGIGDRAETRGRIMIEMGYRKRY